MQATTLPNDAKAGPTKPEVRAVLARKLALGSDDHFVEVGSCTGAVTIEAARRAGRVTALERKAERLEATRANLAANEYGRRRAFPTTATWSFSADRETTSACSTPPSPPTTTGS